MFDVKTLKSSDDEYFEKKIKQYLNDGYEVISADFRHINGIALWYAILKKEM